MSEVKALVEAALFMAGRTVSLREVSEVVGAPPEEVSAAVEALVAEYSGRESGVAIEWDGKSASMHVKPEIEDKIMSLAPAVHMNKAMLKTLAVIASEGPLRQSELVRRRGNRVYHYAEKLLNEGLITAKKSGRTKLLSTTPKFKEYFKIKEVPKVAAAAEPEVEPIAAPEPQAEENDNHVQFDLK